MSALSLCLYRRRSQADSEPLFFENSVFVSPKSRLLAWFPHLFYFFLLSISSIDVRVCVAAVYGRVWFFIPRNKTPIGFSSFRFCFLVRFCLLRGSYRSRIHPSRSWRALQVERKETGSIVGCCILFEPPGHRCRLTSILLRLVFATSVHSP